MMSFSSQLEYPTRVCDLNHQVNIVLDLLNGKVKNLYYNKDQSFMQRISNLNTTTNKNESFEMDTVNTKLNKLEYENDKLKQKVSNLKYNSNSNGLSTLLLANALSKPSVTVQNITYSGKDTESKKEQTKEPIKESTGFTVSDAIGYAITVGPIVVASMYTIIKDDKMNLHFTKIDNEVNQLQKILWKFIPNNQVEFLISSECNQIIMAYQRWRNKFAARVNGLFYTKVGGSITAVAGLTGYWFAIPMLLAGSALFTVPLAAVGAWYYFTIEDKMEELPDFNKLIGQAETTKNMIEANCLPKQPVLYPKLDEPDNLLDTMPSVPTEAPSYEEPISQYGYYVKNMYDKK